MRRDVTNLAQALEEKSQNKEKLEKLENVFRIDELSVVE